MELTAFHPSASWNFEMDPESLENLAPLVPIMELLPVVPKCSLFKP
jgi:hypothetical protein